MTVTLFAALAAGGALYCLWAAWDPPAPSLARRLDRLHEPPIGESLGVWRARWQQWALRALSVSATDRRRLDTDLAICDQTVEHHAVTKLAYATAGLLAPIGCAALGRGAGIDVPTGVVVLLAGGLTAAGYLLPDISLRQRAEERRREFRYALNLVLELVVIAIEGGEGPHAALRKAAEAGSGWSFEAIRRALTTAWLEVESPWRALQRLAEQIGSVELTELAGAVELAATRGAPPQQSLRAKAATVRDHELNDTRAEAIAASTRMGGPMIGLFVGFLILIGYPAITQILNL
jgi:tight adherence protein C